MSGRFEIAIPVLAVVDAREPVAAVFERVVGAEQAGLHLLRFGTVAAEDEHVPDGHLAERFREDIVQVPPRPEILEIRLISLLRGLQVETVVTGIVEEVALDSPGLAVHLFPLGARIDVHLEVLGLEHPLIGRSGRLPEARWASPAWA